MDWVRRMGSLEHVCADPLPRRVLLAGAAGATAGALLGTTTAAAATSKVLFAAAHPDDETTGMSVAIAEHVAAGLDVHVLWVTSGEATGTISTLNGTGVNGWWGVQHQPALEGYAPLTRTTLAAARLREAGSALRCLVAGLPGKVTTHIAGLPDGGVTVDAARGAILSVCDRIAPGGAVRLKGHSPVVDNHPDHLAIGKALRNLSAAYPARFGDRRYYVLPTYWSDARLSQVSWAWDAPNNTNIRARALNACNAYRSWAPDLGRFAVGYHSIANIFATLVTAPKCMYHL